MRKAKVAGHRLLSNSPPEGEAWVWMTRNMLCSITFRALGVSARRILDALQAEQMAHGGAANGNLGGTYRQLEQWGVTAADVPKGYAELYATGFVRKTVQGLAADGGGTPSRYALTWMPTAVGSPDAAPATHEWKRVIDRLNREGVGSIAAARRWLKAEVAEHNRGSRKQAPRLQVVSPIKREAG